MNYLKKAIVIQAYFIFVASQQISRYIFENYYYSPCQNDQDNPMRSYSQSSLLGFISQASVINSFSIQGWILFRNNLKQENLFLTIKEPSFLSDLSSSYINGYIKMKLSTSTLTMNESIITANKWFFIKVVYSFSSSNMVASLILIQNNLSYSLPFSPISRSNGFDISQIRVEFGSTSNFPCVMYRQFAFIQSNQIIPTSMTDTYQDTTVISSSILFSFDLYFFVNNKGYSLSSGENQSKLIIPHQRYTGVFLASEILKTDFINISYDNGILLYFEAKVIGECKQIGKTCQFLRIIDQLNNIIYNAQSIDGNQIQMSSGFVNPSNLSVWNSYLIKIKRQVPNGSFLIKGYENQLIDLGLTSALTVQFQFTLLELNNIRIYKGTYYQENYQNCLINTPFNSNQCLFCKPTFLLDYQNNKQCVASSSTNQSTQINGIKDWSPTRLICPPNMIIDNNDSSKCTCLIGFFKDATQNCQKCPRYCKECDINGCTVKDPKRDSNGQCQNGYFDDGYGCIQPHFLITEFETFQSEFEKPFFGQSCPSLEETDLTKCQLNNSKAFQGVQNFFVSFSFSSIWSFANQGSASQIILDHFYSSSQIFYITASIIDSTTIEIRLTYPSTGIQFTYSQYNQPIIIGYYFNDKDLVITAYFNGQSNSKRVVINSGLPDLQYFHIGKCTSSAIKHACSSIGDRPFKFIKKLTFPSPEGLKFLHTLYQKDKKVIAQFVHNKKQVDYDKYQLDLISSSIKLEFPQSLESFDREKGFNFSPNKYGTIIGLTQTDGPFSFLGYLEIVSLQYQTSFLKYSVGSTNVEIFLIPNNSLEISTIRLCFQNQCQDTIDSFIYWNEPTYFVVIFRQMNPFTKEVNHVEFDIVCNYKKETLTFVDEYTDLTIDSTNIKIAYQTTDNGLYSFYLNYLHIFQGDGFFYFHYENTHFCFLTMNFSQQQCLYLKKGYIYCNGKVDTIVNCEAIMNIRKTIIYKNQFSQKYTDSKISNKNCLEIDLEGTQLVCVKCKDPNKSLETVCEKCNEGLFFNQKSNLCQQCDKKCLACEDKSDKCTICRDQLFQFPPSCNCLLNNYYKDENYNCKQCDSKCSSCELLEKVYCNSCADKRKNSPDCPCDEFYYKELNGVCEEFECNKSICEICLGEPNKCMICAENRANPPVCDCEDGYELQADLSCKKCELKYYFNSSLKKCQPCQSSCLLCSSNRVCEQCEDGFVIKNMQCACSSEFLSIYLISGELKCMLPMHVQLSIIFNVQRKFYEVNMSFTQDLYPYKLSEYKFSDILNIQLSVEGENAYSLENPQIKENNLTFELHFTKSIKIERGRVLILFQQFFISKDLSYVIDEVYILQPIEFKIGPFIADEKYTQSVEAATSMNSLKDTQGSSLEFIKNFQFIFYILNTLQPTILFFLLKLEFPINLYCFYQTVGTLVFPFVPEYQNSKLKNNFSIFGKIMNETEIQITRIQPYKKLGFSNSLIINIPLICIKYIVIIALILLIYCLHQIFFDSFKQETSQKIQNAIVFLVNRLNDENEANLLMILLSIYTQYYSIEQDSFYYRSGSYFSLLFILMMITSLYVNFKFINQQNNSSEKYSSIFINRVQNKANPWERNYFLMQLMKKIIVVTAIFFLYNFPYYACSFCGIIFIISGVITIIIKPYKTPLSRFLKIMSDFILSLVFFLHIGLIYIENKFESNSSDNEEQFKVYQNLGLAIMYILISFNLIFLFQIIIHLIKYIYSLLKLLKEKSGKKNQYQQIEIKNINNIPKLTTQSIMTNFATFQDNKMKKIKLTQNQY